MDNQSSNFPTGQLIPGMWDERIRTGSAPLSEAEREDLLFRYKDAQRDEDKEPDALSEEENMGQLFRGPGIG